MSGPGLTREEDVHFYLDNAPPEEVMNVLRLLSPTDPLTLDEIAKLLLEGFGFRMQRDRTYSPRRLYDLGLADQFRRGSRISYGLTEQGVKVQRILVGDRTLAADVLHYLHYSRFSGKPNDRKYLWSYRRCCEHIWARGEVIALPQMASIIQEEMREKYSYLDYSARQGARFDATAAGRVRAWIRALDPAPFEGRNSSLVPRTLNRPELALLALDDTYRSRGYAYGDPLLLDRDLVRQVAGVFFLDLECCVNLLRIAACITTYVRFSDTLMGPSVNLLRPFGIDDI